MKNGLVGAVSILSWLETSVIDKAVCTHPDLLLKTG